MVTSVPQRVSKGPWRGHFTLQVCTDCYGLCRGRVEWLGLIKDFKFVPLRFVTLGVGSQLLCVRVTLFPNHPHGIQELPVFKHIAKQTPRLDHCSTSASLVIYSSVETQKYRYLGIGLYGLGLRVYNPGLFDYGV